MWLQVFQCITGKRSAKSESMEAASVNVVLRAYLMMVTVLQLPRLV